MVLRNMLVVCVREGTACCPLRVAAGLAKCKDPWNMWEEWGGGERSGLYGRRRGR